MPRHAKDVVLDSWAVLAFLQDEPAGKQVADIIADIHEAGAGVYMTVANAGEVWYIVAREASESDADTSVADLQKIGVQLVDINWELTRIAARLKARGRLSYADAYAAALAKQSKCELLTGDPEFQALDGEIKIRWLANVS